MDIDATQAIDFDIEEEDTCEDSAEKQREPVGYLLVHEQKGLQRKKCPVYEGDNIIGRNQSCHIYIPSVAISKEHACIVVTSGCHLLYDKGSRNKSRRDKLFLTPDVRYELKHDDELTFGDVRCTYTVETKASTKDGDSGSETEEEVEKAEEDYASDASSDILQPTQPYDEDNAGVPFGTSSESVLNTPDKNANHSTKLADDSVSVIETPDFLKNTSKANVNGTPAGAFVLSETGSETDDDLPPKSLLAKQNQRTPVKQSPKTTPTKAGQFSPAPTQMYSMDFRDDGSDVEVGKTQAYDMDMKDEESDEDVTVPKNMETQAYNMDLKDDESDSEEEEREKNNSAQREKGKREEKQREKKRNEITEKEKHDKVEEEKDAGNTPNSEELKKDSADESKNVADEKTDDADLVLETQDPEGDDAEEENADHLNDLFSTSTLAFASDDEMEGEGNGGIINETTHFDDATKVSGDDATQAVEEDKTQAIGGDDDNDATQAVDGDDATQAVAGDDATQPVGGEDKTQVVSDITQPVSDITQPISDITQPVSDITQPVNDVTQPVSDVTQPVSDATQPVNETSISGRPQRKNAGRRKGMSIRTEDVCATGTVSAAAIAAAETVPVSDTLPMECTDDKTPAVNRDSTLPISDLVVEKTPPKRNQKKKSPYETSPTVIKTDSGGFTVLASESKLHGGAETETLKLADNDDDDHTPELKEDTAGESSEGTMLPQVVSEGEIGPHDDVTQEVIPESQEDGPNTSIINLPEKSPLKSALVDKEKRKRSPSPSPRRVAFADTTKGGSVDSDRGITAVHTPAAAEKSTRTGRVSRRSVTAKDTETEEASEKTAVKKEKTEVSTHTGRGRPRGRGKKAAEVEETENTADLESSGSVDPFPSTTPSTRLSAVKRDKSETGGVDTGRKAAPEARRSGRARRAKREYSPTPDAEDVSEDTSLNASNVDVKKRGAGKKKQGHEDDEQPSLSHDVTSEPPPVEAEEAVSEKGKEEVEKPAESTVPSPEPEETHPVRGRGRKSRGHSAAQTDREVAAAKSKTSNAEAEKPENAKTAMENITSDSGDKGNTQAAEGEKPAPWNTKMSRGKRNSSVVAETQPSKRSKRTGGDSLEGEQTSENDDSEFKIPEPVKKVDDKGDENSASVKSRRTSRRGKTDSDGAHEKTKTTRRGSVEVADIAENKKSVTKRLSTARGKRQSSLKKNEESSVDTEETSSLDDNSVPEADKDNILLSSEASGSAIPAEPPASENKRTSARNRGRPSASKRKSTLPAEDKASVETEHIESALNETQTSAAGKGRGRTAARKTSKESETSSIDESETASSKKGTTDSETAAEESGTPSVKGRGRASTSRQSTRHSVASKPDETSTEITDADTEGEESKGRGRSRKRKACDDSAENKSSKASRSSKQTEDNAEPENSEASLETEVQKGSGRGTGRKKRQAEEPASPAPSKQTRRTMDDAKALSSPAPTKRSLKDESTISSPTLRRTTLSSKPKVLFTGVIDEPGQKIVKELGGDMAKSIEDCTHLITDKVRRTVKFLGGLARGVSIVTPQWLDSSKAAGTFVDASMFMVQDSQMEKQYKFNLVHSVQKASQSPMLQGYRIHVTKSVRPEPAQMKDILACAGAQYLATVPSKAAENTVVVSCEEDRTKCNAVLKAGIPVVSAEFILTGILKQEADIESFRLFGDQASGAEGKPSSSRRRR